VGIALSVLHVTYTLGNDSGKLFPCSSLCMRCPCTHRIDDQAGVRVFRKRLCEAIHKSIDILLCSVVPIVKAAHTAAAAAAVS
jgi:hypothetical protein